MPLKIMKKKVYSAVKRVYIYINIPFILVTYVSDQQANVNKPGLLRKS